MKPVYVLPKIKRVDDFLLIKFFGQWNLYQNCVNFIIMIQKVDGFEDLILLGIFIDTVEMKLDACFFRRLGL